MDGVHVPEPQVAAFSDVDDGSEGRFFLASRLRWGLGRRAVRLRLVRTHGWVIRGSLSVFCVFVGLECALMGRSLTGQVSPDLQ